MFHFVDRIVRFEPGRHAVGVKHVTAADAFLYTRNGARSLRSCIVGEALGQLAAWVVMQANGFSLRPVAGIARDVEISGTAVPGDALVLDATIDSVGDGVVGYHALATVGGRRILAIDEGLGPLLPLEEFDDPDRLRRHFARIQGPDGAEAVPPGAGNPTPLAPSWIEFDQIRSWDAGRSAEAGKRISAAWPFFGDHFPRKPVFPLSLLLECLLGLGETLLADVEPAAAPLLPARIRRVKMNRFIEPGETVIARAEVRSRSGADAALAFRCEVEGQRACIAEADYARAGSSR